MWTWHFSWSGAFKMTNPHRVLCAVAVFLREGARNGFLPVLEGLNFCSCFTQCDLPRDSLFKESSSSGFQFVYLFIRLPQQYPGLVCKYHLKIGNSFKLHFYLFCVHVWRSEDILQELILCFHHVGPGSQTQVVRLGCRH